MFRSASRAVFKAAVAAAAAPRPHMVSTRMPGLVAARYNSTDASLLERRKAAQELQDELSKDWRLPVISYEQLKPKTESPSPVSF
jgi:thiosulfate:glutathione sulfurtransferase